MLDRATPGTMSVYNCTDPTGVRDRGRAMRRRQFREEPASMRCDPMTRSGSFPSIASLPANVFEPRFDRVQTRGDLIELRRQRVGPGALEALPRGLNERRGDHGSDNGQE